MTNFLKRLVIMFLHLLTLTGAIYFRGESDSDGEDTSELDVARYSFEIASCLGCCIYCFLQQGGEIRNQGFFIFLRNLAHSPEKAIFLLSNVLIISCVPLRVAQLLTGSAWTRQVEEAILAIAAPGSWFFLMFFAGAVKLTGPFVTMIYSMVTGDMLTFAIIYAIMLLAFTQAFFFLYMGHEDVKDTYFSDYFSTWMGLFHMTLGEYQMDHDLTSYPILTTFIFGIFMVLVPILLLNMLIAMMGNTYASVIERSEKEWVKQWANIVINLERAESKSKAKEHLYSYSIKLGGAAEDGTEQRAVMVIKSKNKTRARQRKGALSNWKRVGRIIIDELRKQGCGAAELRRRILNKDPDGGNGGGGPPPPSAGAAVLANAFGCETEGDGNTTVPTSAPSWLGDAVNQLAWQHDLDLSRTGETAIAATPTNTNSGTGGGLANALSQLAFANDLNLDSSVLASEAAASPQPLNSDIKGNDLPKPVRPKIVVERGEGQGKKKPSKNVMRVKEFHDGVDNLAFMDDDGSEKFRDSKKYLTVNTDLYSLHVGEKAPSAETAEDTTPPSSQKQQSPKGTPKSKERASKFATARERKGKVNRRVKSASVNKDQLRNRKANQEEEISLRPRDLEMRNGNMSSVIQNGAVETRPPRQRPWTAGAHIREEKLRNFSSCHVKPMNTMLAWDDDIGL
ncbi:unnamed protein product [Darwinula stevensoni]|uniref:Ion transport domain-containing protein n=1 Tax=Darwinula stevensoni TaxID=69355 RepID=A0A7R8X9Y4_9CRUS|nr:unnamed protein product [Darwinula stevensoni]CAG0891540.1 unnamed protein product [Darwinula stevensoni]